MQISRKAIVSVGLTAIMVLLLVGVVAQMQFGRNFSTKTKASANDVTLAFTETAKTVSPGQSFTLSITAASAIPASPYHLSAGELTISYPKSLMTVDSIEPYIDTLKPETNLIILRPLGKSTDTTNEFANIVIGSNCSATSCTGRPASGFLATVKMHSLTAGSGTVQFSTVEPNSTKLAAIEDLQNNVLAKTLVPLTLTVLGQIVPTSTPTVTPIVPTVTPKPTVTRVPTATPTRIPLPTATLTPKPTLTLTPIPTRVPVPTVCTPGPTSCSCPGNLSGAQWLCSYPAYWGFYRWIFTHYYGPNNALEQCFHTPLSCTQ